MSKSILATQLLNKLGYSSVQDEAVRLQRTEILKFEIFGLRDLVILWPKKTAVTHSILEIQGSIDWI